MELAAAQGPDCRLLLSNMAPDELSCFAGCLSRTALQSQQSAASTTSFRSNASLWRLLGSLAVTMHLQVETVPPTDDSRFKGTVLSASSSFIKVSLFFVPTGFDSQFRSLQCCRDPLPSLFSFSCCCLPVFGHQILKAVSLILTTLLFFWKAPGTLSCCHLSIPTVPTLTSYSSCRSCYCFLCLCLS